MLTTRIQRHNSERGSLVLALCVLVTITTLSIVVVLRSINAVNIAEAQERYDAARQAADSGLAAALATLDGQGALGSLSTLNGTNTLGSSTYSWTANKVSDTEWNLQSEGQNDGLTVKLESNSTRSSGFPYAIFTNQNIDFGTTTAINVRSVDSRVGTALSTGDAIVGSNSQLLVEGTAGGNEQHPFTAHGSCLGSGCTNVVVQAGPRALPNPAEPAVAQACPAGGIFGNTIDGGIGNAYVCNTDVTLPAGAVSILNAPFILYMAPGTNLTIAGGSSLNWQQNATNVQILKAGPGTVALGDNSAPAQIFGLLYAPHATVVVNGASPAGTFNMGGSLTAEQLVVPPGTTGEFRYDDAVKALPQSSWVLHDWRQLSAL